MRLLEKIPTRPEVTIPLPTKLEGLRRLAYNLYWTWNPPVRDLFRRVDAARWAQHRNPIPVLEARVDWSDLLDNATFMADYQSALERFDAYLADEASHWFGRQGAEKRDPFCGPIAYFCAEFGLHESLNIYSGGLGVLAGDHLKAASDSGIPLLAVGLFYRHGYFRQSIDADGHQEHAYPDLEPALLPVQEVLDPASGRPLRISIDFEGRAVQAGLHLVQVGRVPLLLLDTDIPENSAADRPITGQLYVRGREMRLHQEIVLGVGGVRALRALDIAPSCWHLNEGHSAFMIVERIREKTQAGTDFTQAVDEVKRDAVFTIHTPVSAGNERFDASLVRRLAQPFLASDGVNLDAVLELGRGVETDASTFDMTAFSLRCSVKSNAVSHLHSHTANGTWKPLGKEILGLTNGVHMPTWTGPHLAQLFTEGGAALQDLNQDDPARRLWEHIDDLDDRRLWEEHIKQKRRLAYFLRKRIREQLARHGEAPSTLQEVSEALDPDVLTIGFARRFATYKRAALIFTDEERLARLIHAAGKPVQFIFAGKAHPADRPGQGVIQHIFTKSREERFRGKIFILEDYDMRIGRFLTQGCDVWMNNPRRPLEASGTSGMKAAANGVPNCSILDGWWDEGFHGDNGWAIGGRETHEHNEEQDRRDADALYSVLENEVVPRFYDRGEDGLPHAWLHTMKRAIATSLWDFSMSRCVQEYTERMYVDAARASR